MTLVEPFRVRLEVRVYELDPQRHLTGAAYLQYAEQARFACVRAAGVDVDAMLAGGVGPVNLDSHIRYHSELVGGDEVDVSCVFGWDDGKTYRAEHEIRRVDGKLAAEVRHVSGMLDLEKRRLLTDPAGQWRARASRPGLLGLA